MPSAIVLAVSVETSLFAKFPPSALAASKLRRIQKYRINRLRRRVDSIYGNHALIKLHTQDFSIDD